MVHCAIHSVGRHVDSLLLYEGDKEQRGRDGLVQNDVICWHCHSDILTHMEVIWVHHLSLLRSGLSILPHHILTPAFDILGCSDISYCFGGIRVDIDIPK